MLRAGKDNMTVQTLSHGSGTVRPRRCSLFDPGSYFLSTGVAEPAPWSGT
jgi:hypothetical protein